MRSPYCPPGCPPLLIHSGISCVPSLSGLFFTYKGSHFDRQHSHNLPFISPNPPLLIPNPSSTFPLPFSRFKFTLQGLVIQRRYQLSLSCDRMLVTNSIACDPTDVSSDSPDSLQLPNLLSVSTLLNLTRCALLLKRPIREREESLNLAC